MKKVLLFDTAIATSNLGDEIIFKGVKDGMKAVLYNTMNYRLATHIENYSPIQMLYHGKKMTSICLEADYKFIAGTNLLVDNLLHFRPQLAVNPFNALLYKDSVLVGVGKESDYSKFKNKYTISLYQKILSNRYKHSVRDEETKKMLESIGIKAINTGCPTLWMFNEDKCRRIPKMKSDNVVFSVSGYSNQLDREADRLMIELLMNNYKKLYAWIQTTEDEQYLNTLVDIEKQGIECIYSLDKYNDILLRGNIDYVGTRLHGGIFALQHEIRSIIISIDQRAEGFYRSNNIPILRRNEIENLEKVINSEFATDIKVDRGAINEFLSQFI